MAIFFNPIKRIRELTVDLERARAFGDRMEDLFREAINQRTEHGATIAAQRDEIEITRHQRDTALAQLQRAVAEAVFANLAFRAREGAIAEANEDCSYLQEEIGHCQRQLEQQDRDLAEQAQLIEEQDLQITLGQHALKLFLDQDGQIEGLKSALSMVTAQRDVARDARDYFHRLAVQYHEESRQLAESRDEFMNAGHELSEQVHTSRIQILVQLAAIQGLNAKLQEEQEAHRETAQEMTSALDELEAVGELVRKASLHEDPMSEDLFFQLQDIKDRTREFVKDIRGCTEDCPECQAVVDRYGTAEEDSIPF